MNDRADGDAPKGGGFGEEGEEGARGPKTEPIPAVTRKDVRAGRAGAEAAAPAERGAGDAAARGDAASGEDEAPKSEARRSATKQAKGGHAQGKKRSRGPSSAPASGSSGGREASDRWERTRANIKTIGGAVLLAIVIRIGLFEAFEIEGPSMEPTLLNGDRVVVAKFSYGLFLPFASDAILTWDTPEPGEVVIVKSPHDDIDIVKRVIGVPGDTIEIREDVVYRNGSPIEVEVLGPCVAEPGVTPDDGGTECVQEGVEGHLFRTSRDISSPPSSHPPTTVPDDHVYIMGDHRDRSNDSRFFGVVPTSRVKGHALVIYWSSGSKVRWDRIFDGVE